VVRHIGLQLHTVGSARTAGRYRDVEKDAIVLWDTVYLERATQALCETDKPIDNVMLQYLSPLGWEHINLTGDYVWRQSRKIEDGQFRPLRINGKR
jgi:hypothetical protein